MFTASGQAEDPREIYGWSSVLFNTSASICVDRYKLNILSVLPVPWTGSQLFSDRSHRSVRKCKFQHVSWQAIGWNLDDASWSRELASRRCARDGTMDLLDSNGNPTLQYTTIVVSHSNSFYGRSQQGLTIFQQWTSTSQLWSLVLAEDTASTSTLEVRLV